jgi:hypothetical protein
MFRFWEYKIRRHLTPSNRANWGIQYLSQVSYATLELLPLFFCHFFLTPSSPISFNSINRLFLCLIFLSSINIDYFLIRS